MEIKRDINGLISISRSTATDKDVLQYVLESPRIERGVMLRHLPLLGRATVFGMYAAIFWQGATR